MERDAARCVELAEQLPGAQILNEDGSNREFLLSEGLESTEAFVALTNIDEENVLLTLFAKKHSNGKLVTKINRLEFATTSKLCTASWTTAWRHWNLQCTRRAPLPGYP